MTFGNASANACLLWIWMLSSLSDSYTCSAFRGTTRSHAYKTMIPKVNFVQLKRSALRLRQNDYVSNDDELSNLLRSYGYDRRLLEIRPGDLPLLAEVFVDGTSVLGQIVQFLSSSVEPKVVVFLGTKLEQMVVDLGQVTTIWDKPVDHDADANLPPLPDWDEVVSQAQIFSKDNAEGAFDRLYRTRVGRARSSTNGLSKRDVTRLVQLYPDAEQARVVDVLLRKLIKAGSGLSRLVDSSVAKAYLFRGMPEKAGIQQRAVASYLLAHDAAAGGRFKRWPCGYVTSAFDQGSLLSISVLNGGWLVVDQSVRAGTEARKFVQRAADNDGTVSSVRAGKSSTAADERILQRLECLAMGELFSKETSDERDLELDVREVLNGMNLSLSPQGAKKALIQVGWWSGMESFDRIEPWPKEVLDASAWYSKWARKNLGSGEKRVDLTHLPAIAIDAKKTSFCDDAIGVRPRASTGRAVDLAVSKWEVLIHITDMSDIYAATSLDSIPDPEDHLLKLRDAARRRGTSRYDLPLGPLHLLPPVVLQALSLSSRKESHRCVTLWAYIDERTGRLRDAGIERTVISSPVHLSYEAATALMTDSTDANSISLANKARAILLVSERNLQLWNNQHRDVNQAAQKREQRLAARALNNDVSHTFGASNGHFQRTRGHRLVDSSLQLYAYAINDLLRKAKAPIPIAAGADASRSARVATAPLRRYIDGESQRQALAVLCGYGTPMTIGECREAGIAANGARNAISNFRAVRKK